MISTICPQNSVNSYQGQQWADIIMRESCIVFLWDKNGSQEKEKRLESKEIIATSDDIIPSLNCTRFPSHGFVCVAHKACSCPWIIGLPEATEFDQIFSQRPKLTFKTSFYFFYQVPNENGCYSVFLPLLCCGSQVWPLTAPPTRTPIGRKRIF